ncbi:TIGR04255 family protein [Polynucleobacter sp. AP-Capit-er-40B-B4]|uniref:TIGR04255 family protein n=1 Tax=Polynucleobacter sp. AP-Capit-er-40B-B4 TaxID=2576927 RepID=UPI001C0DE3C1|nr:TIGR04255 family protein [Polynucleobacter sp. AP-Capit-er-40B-B4]MBU3581343.1 TIGR04255 family protein [Polynucleobacter sp. AP-Capit-er-40B-B4]
MAKASKNYIHPPITEAVIAINFKSTIGFDDLTSVSKKYQKEYPQSQAVSNLSFTVDVDGEGGVPIPKNTQNQKGWRLSSNDMTQILVLWPQSFTISQLAPYVGWETFLERFMRDWKKFKRNIGQKEIARIGVRYINRIDIPVTGDIVEHEKYLNIFPKLPNSLTPLHAFAVQSALKLPDIGCDLLINSAAAPSPILDHASFMLDLDIFRVEDLPQSDQDIYNLLNEIRNKKNKVFEQCISNRARKLFG